MPENIIKLDDHRGKKSAPKLEAQAYLERMSMIEDVLEQLDELGVSNREELVAMLEELEANAPDTVE